MMDSLRYFLDSDNDGHWYLIESTHRQDWEEWLELDSEDEKAWDVPYFAEALDGGPNQVDFENPTVPK